MQPDQHGPRFPTGDCGLEGSWMVLAGLIQGLAMFNSPVRRFKGGTMWDIIGSHGGLKCSCERMQIVRTEPGLNVAREVNRPAPDLCLSLGWR